MSEKKVYALCNFKTHKPDDIVPKIQEKLRDEAKLGPTSPLPYDIEGATSGQTTAGTVLNDALRMIATHSAKGLFTLHFKLEQPRLFQLRIQLTRGAVGSFVGGLLYSTQLHKAISGEVVLEKPKTFGNSKFTGESTVSEKLNQNADFLKKANKFSRIRIGYNGISVQIERFFKIVPNEGGALLVINTLPKTGLASTLLNVEEFLELATMLEAIL